MSKNNKFDLVNLKDFLFISDLDGTLLLPNGTLPEEFKYRLNKLISDGMRFTIATARNYDSAYPILKGLNLTFPVVLFNGVYLADFHSGEILEHTQFIDKTVIDSMLDLAKINKIEPFIYTFGNQNQVYYRKVLNTGSTA